MIQIPSIPKYVCCLLFLLSGERLLFAQGYIYSGISLEELQKFRIKSIEIQMLQLEERKISKSLKVGQIEYDSKGLIQEEHYLRPPIYEVVTLFDSIYYKYNDQQQLIRKVKVHGVVALEEEDKSYIVILGGKDADVTTFLYTYDSQGLLVKEFTCRPYLGDTLLKEFAYNSQGKKIALLHKSSTYPEADRENYTETYVYNDKGLLYQIKKSHLDFEAFSIETFFYDNNQRLIRKELKNEVSIGEVYDQNQNYLKLYQDSLSVKVEKNSYDKLGNLIKIENLIITDTIAQESFIKKKFNDQNQLIEIRKNWFTDKILFMFFPHEKFSYFPSGLLHRREILSTKGEAVLVFEYKYTFY